MRIQWKILIGLIFLGFLWIMGIVLKKEYAKPVVVERSMTGEQKDSVIPSTERNDALSVSDKSIEAVSPDVSTQPVQGASDTKPASTKEASPEKSSSIAETPASFAIIDRSVNFGFEKADRKAKDIDTVVLHSSYNNQGGDQYSVDKVISIWKSYGVAPHYLIDRKGQVYRLVVERNIAYHAGVSEMKDGRKNVNDFSIGVEILNTETDSYTDAQYLAVKHLVSSLKKTYPIQYVVGHDDIAPGRKTDPWNFDWKRIR